MRTESFVCLRPNPESAQTFAALPYDVYTTAEAAEFVATHPGSFLAIDRAETAFAPGHDIYADDVYEKASELLEARVEDGTLIADNEPAYYLYHLDDGVRSETGIVAACSIDDYDSGAIRRHELTRAGKEADRIRHITVTGCQTGPIFLAYRDDEAVAACMERTQETAPIYDFTSEEGVHQVVWRLAGDAAAELKAALDRVPRAYIADGHHRAASAARVCATMRSSDADHQGNEAYNYLLAVLFPASCLSILPYNRLVFDTCDYDENGLVWALEEAGISVGPRVSEAIVPTEPTRFGMFAFGAWRELKLKTAPETDDPVASLDVSILQERVLAPILGINDPRTSERIRFVGGIVTPDELAAMAGDTGVAFQLYPTTMDQLMAVADANMLMPPKSTWFEPKLRSGLFIRRIADPTQNVDGTTRA